MVFTFLLVKIISDYPQSVQQAGSLCWQYLILAGAHIVRFPYKDLQSKISVIF